MTLELTSKENCSELRAAKVTNLACELEPCGACIEVHGSKGAPNEAARATESRVVTAPTWHGLVPAMT